MNVRKIANTIKNIAYSAIVVGAWIFAGISDYNDAVIAEMKNNGEYERLSELHPQASEAELVDIYEEEIR